MMRVYATERAQSRAGKEARVGCVRIEIDWAVRGDKWQTLLNMRVSVSIES